MKVILVDDEPLALSYLSDELQQIHGVEIQSVFRNPRLAFDFICNNETDAVFLDIEMPGMSGIELAELILQHRPGTRIVFATVYDEFAIKAFELHAIDYILKPLHTDRLKITIERIRESINTQSTQTKPLPSKGLVKIHCFRSLQFERSNKENITLRWKTLKAQELFCLLLKLRGRPVRKQTLVDQLWPHTEWKKGITQLYTAIYQIRKMFQDELSNVQISNCDEGYRLDLQQVQLDIEEWERLLGAAPPLSDSSLDEHKQIFALYQGDYLAEYDYLWVETERQRLRAIWLTHAQQITSYYIANNRWGEAAAHCLRMQTILPLEESIYMQLMLIYEQLNEKRSVEAQYELLKSRLLLELDVEPQASITEWFEHWQRSSNY
jgi:two-component system LytT family response regulator